MQKTILTVAIAMLATTAVQARDTDQQRFVRDDNTYVYKTSVRGDRQYIDGRRYPAGAAFHLVIRNDRVSGTSGGVPVAFKVPARTAAIETAAR